MTDREPAPRSLRDVAQRALDKHEGVSGRELDRIAKRRGLKIVYTTINHIAAGTYKSKPSRGTLEALADLSGYPRAVVYAAAEQPMPLASLADQLPPDADLLTGAQRDAVLAIIRQFATTNRLIHDARDRMVRGAPGVSPELLLAAAEIERQGGLRSVPVDVAAADTDAEQQEPGAAEDDDA